MTRGEILPPDWQPDAWHDEREERRSLARDEAHRYGGRGQWLADAWHEWDPYDGIDQ